MSAKSGLKTCLKTCLKTLLQCFAIDAFCSEAKHCRSVLRHVLRPDFVDILQLLVPVFCFAELIQISLWAIWVEQHASYRTFAFCLEGN